jgi:cell division protein FtsB
MMTPDLAAEVLRLSHLVRDLTHKCAELSATVDRLTAENASLIDANALLAEYAKEMGK